MVFKRGAQDCLLKTAESVKEIRAEHVKKVIDTTAAGDSFDAAYLAARISSISPEQAVKSGHLLAAQVIQYRGAIMPKSST